MEAAVTDQEAVAAMATLRAWAGRLAGRVGWVQEPDVSDLVVQLGSVLRCAEGARVALVAEAAQRGLAASSGPFGSLGGDLKAWVGQRSPGVPVGEVARVVRVVQGGRTRTHAPVLAAVTWGRVGLVAADLALGEMTRLKPLLNPDVVEAVWESYLMLAETGDLKLVRALRPAMIARFGGEGELQDRQDTAKARTGLTRPRPLDDKSGCEGLVEYRLVTDAEGRAVIEAAIGPLSAPVPGPDGEPDPRTATRRRAEALVGMLRRATEAGEKVPSVAKTQLMLTIRATDLVAGSNAAEVLGSLDTGLLLGTETARKLACDAAITPVVLDEEQNLLHLGRTRRLFTPTQLKALWCRDRHCTYPGCDTPAHWCDAHHVVHWVDGGPTDLDNAALLCGFHHTLVHQRRLTATLTRSRGRPDSSGGGSGGNGGGAPVGCGSSGVNGGGAPVGWDLTPGSYDRALASDRDRPRDIGSDPPPCVA